MGGRHVRVNRDVTRAKPACRKKDNSQTLPLTCCSPPGPFDEVGQVVEQVECIEGISYNLCHRPYDQEKDNAFFVLDLLGQNIKGAIEGKGGVWWETRRKTVSKGPSLY